MFPQKDVAKILESEYVEARLHTDKKEGMRNFNLNERILEMRDKLVGANNVARPIYVVLDPESEKKILTRKGSAAVSVFLKFFKDALVLAGRKKT